MSTGERFFVVGWQASGIDSEGKNQNFTGEAVLSTEGHHYLCRHELEQERRNFLMSMGYSIRTFDIRWINELNRSEMEDWTRVPVDAQIIENSS